ncbi:beta-1,4-galactosyltransferase 7 [Cryptotermes secundus]|uniref:beta-1,4-galactosyltransferase 7 n=1 Tax=Cryptotermes secundus TaxID=105785 RepID=UPI001454C485|nr:beta-1,4-galactosyltransferase 7 [Cryptotermes secundus]
MYVSCKEFLAEEVLMRGVSSLGQRVNDRQNFWLCFAAVRHCSTRPGCFLAISPITIDDCQCSRKDPGENIERHFKGRIYNANSGIPSDHKLAVLVPFRDRFEELLAFAPYLHDFLNKQEISHHIYILNQVDHYRFNRASLINVGFRIARDECDYIAMHDVDLLPLNSQLRYSYPETGPFHIASPDLHPRYHYPTFVGGILLIKREHFELVNGMSNKYWGWGLEDDEFYVRLKEAGLNVSRPVNITTGTENTFKHTHDRTHRKRDMTKCFKQRDVTRRRDRQTGLADVVYKLTGIHELKIDGAPITVINIVLSCDKRLTPWCNCSDTGGKKPSSETNAAESNIGNKNNKNILNQ